MDEINPAITCFFFSGKGEGKRENIRWKGMIPGKAEIGRTDFNSICHKSWRMEVSLRYMSAKEGSLSDSQCALPTNEDHLAHECFQFFASGRNRQGDETENGSIFCQS